MNAQLMENNPFRALRPREGPKSFSKVKAEIIQDIGDTQCIKILKATLKAGIQWKIIS